MTAFTVSQFLAIGILAATAIFAPSADFLYGINVGFIIGFFPVSIGKLLLAIQPRK